MYRSLYGLVESPFNLTPDPRYLFLSRSHQEAYDHLRYGIDQKKGFIEVIGGIGTGKTTLCKALLNNLDPRIKTAYIFNPSVSELELLRAINEEFGLDGRGQTKMELIDSLNRFLIDELAQSGKAVLIIDESQNLDPKVLEEIRMLSNLETDHEKLIQIVLVGQPELHELLSTPSLRQLNERISVRAFLNPLSKVDTKAYINHRLAIAGSKGGIRFTEGALKQIYRYSQGNPRRINNICDRALLIAFTQNSFKIRRSYVTKAISETEGTFIASGPPKGGRIYWLRVILVILMAFPIAFGTGWFLRAKLPSLRPGFHRQPVSSDKGVVPAPPSAIVESPIAEEEAETKTDSNFITHDRSNEEVPKQEGLLNNRGVDLASLKEIFGLLKIPFPNLDPATSSIKRLDLPEITRLARAGGMLVLPMTLDVNRLRSFITPCLLEVYSEELSGRGHIVMKKVLDDIVVASDPKRGEAFYPLVEIERIWFGSSLLFYPRPIKGTVPTLRKGVKNPLTQRLQEQMASLGYYKGGVTGDFDVATKNSVIHFQRDFALQPDGVVGRNTKAILFQLTGKSLYGDSR
jgi:general secretion pathway protein A